MTEDDTFKTLRRKPTDEVFRLWLDSDEYCTWPEHLEKHRWTRDEYTIEMRKRHN